MPRIQHKRGTSANLASVNPTPLAGELVWDSTENAVKIGDGSTAWASLAYVTATPRTHVHDGGDITTGTVAYARLPVGSTASTVCAGDDARLSDARSPTAHKSSHATGGSDALTPSDIGAAPLASPTFTGTVTVPGLTSTGVIAVDRSFLSSSVSGQMTFLGHNVRASATTANTAVVVNGGWISTLIKQYFSEGITFHTSTTSYAANDVYPLADTERMRVAANGNVGIGRQIPASRLDVNGVITVSATSGSAGSYLPSVCFASDANTGLGQVGGADSVSLITAGVERLRVDAGGRLRIGAEAAATHLLEVQGQNATTLASQITVSSGVGGVTQQFRNESATDGAYVATQFWVRNSNGSNQLAAFGCVSNPQATTPWSPDFVWTTRSGGTVSTERMRLRHNGNVGIGTPSPTALLDINADTLRLRTARTPASASAAGNAGDICWDADYLYICIASGTWRRVAHSTW